MPALLAVFAAFEREPQESGVRAGLAHTRRNSKWFSGTFTVALNDDRVHKLSRTGLGSSEITRRLRIGRTSVDRIVADLAKQNYTRSAEYETSPELYPCVEARVLLEREWFANAVRSSVAVKGI